MTDLIKRDDALATIDTFKRDFEQSWKVQFSADIKALPAIDPAATREDALQARIEELVKERDEYKAAAAIWQEDFIQENQRMYEAKVKLAMAVESIKQSIKLWEKPDGGDRLGKLDNAYDGFELLCKALAELEGSE